MASQSSDFDLMDTPIVQGPELVPAPNSLSAPANLNIFATSSLHQQLLCKDVGPDAVSSYAPSRQAATSDVYVVSEKHGDANIDTETSIPGAHNSPSEANDATRGFWANDLEMSD